MLFFNKFFHLETQVDALKLDVVNCYKDSFFLILEEPYQYEEYHLLNMVLRQA